MQLPSTIELLTLAMTQYFKRRIYSCLFRHILKAIWACFLFMSAVGQSVGCTHVLLMQFFLPPQCHQGVVWGPQCPCLLVLGCTARSGSFPPSYTSLPHHSLCCLLSLGCQHEAHQIACSRVGPILAQSTHVQTGGGGGLVLPAAKMCPLWCQSACWFNADGHLSSTMPLCHSLSSKEQGEKIR